MAAERMLNVYPLDDENAEKLSKHYQMCAACFSDAHSILKNYHWNARGKSFYGWHKMLDKISESAESMLEYVDICAELIAQMGYQVYLLPDDIDQFSKLRDVEFKNVGKAEEAAKEITEMYKILITCCNDGVNLAAKLGDNGGGNALQDILQKLNYDAWFVNAWLRNEE